MSAGNWKEMYKAAQDGNLELLRYHIESGVDPNYQHPEILSTPLVTALVAGHTDIALYLLEKNADPHLISYFDNMNAVQAAIRHKNKRVLERLKQMGARPAKSWWQKLFNRS